MNLIDRRQRKLSVRRQCELLSINRSCLYYISRPISERNLNVMNHIDAEFTDHPTTGVESMSKTLHRYHELTVNPKRVRRLMRLMGLMAIYPKPRTTERIIEHATYPCLLRVMDITRPDQVWCSDITYIRMRGGFMYLVAIMDYFSRYVLSWDLSNSLDNSFCLTALSEALLISRPEIFHSDQGKQYTSLKFVNRLKEAGIRVSMSGRRRCFDNILVERLWRTVKQEEVYLHEYDGGWDAADQLGRYFKHYNGRRLHSSIGYQTPEEVYYENRPSLCSAPATPTLRKAKSSATFHLKQADYWS